MILYKIVIEGEYMTFVDVSGTESNGEAVSYRGDTIKEIKSDDGDDFLSLIGIDSYSVSYSYLEVEDPNNVPNVFESLTAFRDYLTANLKSADSGGGASYTFTSGISESTGNVTLGGTLAGPADITLNGNRFRISSDLGMTDELYVSQVVTKITSGRVEILNAGTAYVEVGSKYLNLGPDLDEQALYFNDDGTIKLQHSPTGAGIEYVNDYSANYSLRSLTDKAYVDSVAISSDLLWEIYYPNINSAVEIVHEVASTIDSIVKGVKIQDVEYSVDDGVNWLTPSFPITVLANTFTKWKITAFTGTYTDGTLIIKGTKS